MAEEIDHAADIHASTAFCFTQRGVFFSSSDVLIESISDVARAAVRIDSAYRYRYYLFEVNGILLVSN